MSRIFRDNLLRKRPGAVGVWIVRAPHDVPVAKKIGLVEPDKVGLKRCPNLPFEDLARHRFERNVSRFFSLELPLVAVIHLLHDKGNPADGRFSQAKLQFWMALQRSEVEHVHEWVEKRSRAVAESHIENALSFAWFHGIDRCANSAALHAAA